MRNKGASRYWRCGSFAYQIRILPDLSSVLSNKRVRRSQCNVFDGHNAVISCDTLRCPEWRRACWQQVRKFQWNADDLRDSNSERAYSAGDISRHPCQSHFPAGLKKYCTKLYLLWWPSEKCEHHQEEVVGPMHIFAFIVNEVVCSSNSVYGVAVVCFWREACLLFMIALSKMRFDWELYTISFKNVGERLGATLECVTWMFSWEFEDADIRWSAGCIPSPRIHNKAYSIP